MILKETPSTIDLRYILDKKIKKNRKNNTCNKSNKERYDRKIHDTNDSTYKTPARTNIPDIVFVTGSTPTNSGKETLVTES